MKKVVKASSKWIKPHYKFQSTIVVVEDLEINQIHSGSAGTQACMGHVFRHFSTYLLTYVLCWKKCQVIFKRCTSCKLPLGTKLFSFSSLLRLAWKLGTTGHRRGAGIFPFDTSISCMRDLFLVEWQGLSQSGCSAECGVGICALDVKLMGCSRLLCEFSATKFS